MLRAGKTLRSRSDSRRDGRRAASCLPSTPGRRWKGTAKGRPISDDSPAVEELLPERFYSSRWLWYMTVKLLLDGRVWLLPLATHWACLCGGNWQPDGAIFGPSSRADWTSDYNWDSSANRGVIGRLIGLLPSPSEYGLESLPIRPLRRVIQMSLRTVAERDSDLIRERISSDQPTLSIPMPQIQDIDNC